MNSFIYQCLWILLIYTKPVYNYSTGAPIDACGTMAPGHIGVQSQPCTTNYLIQSNATEYGTNDLIRGKYSEIELYSHQINLRL